MATYGLYFQADEVEVSVVGTGSVVINSSAFDYGWGGRMVSYYRTMFGNMLPGITLQSLNKFTSGTGLYTNECSFEISHASYFISDSYVSDSLNIRAKLIFTDWQLYVVDGLAWTLCVDSIKFYAGDVLANSYGSVPPLIHGSFTPDGRPLIGLPFKVTATFDNTVIPTPLLPLDHCEDPSAAIMWDAQAEADATWRWKKGGTWYSIPIRLPNLDLLPGTCAPTNTPVSPAASTTASMVARARSRYSLERSNEVEVTIPPATGCAEVVAHIIKTFDGVAEYEISAGDLVAIGDLPKTMVKLNPHNDYGAKIGRFGFPKCEVYASVVSADTPPPEFSGGTYSNTSRTQLYPEQSALLAHVTSDVHAIQDTQAYSTYALAGRTSIFHKAWGECCEIVQQGIWACPPCAPEDPPGTVCGTYHPSDCGTITSNYCYVVQGTTFDQGIQRSDTNPQIAGWYDTPDPYYGAHGLYYNTWCSPGWSYFYWFPLDLDPEAPRTTWEWEVFNERANPTLYWLPKRQQWMGHPSLPPNERTYTRNSIVLSPLFHGALTPFLKYFLFGQETNFWGVSRQMLLKKRMREQFSYGFDQASLFTPVDCALTWSGNNPILTPDPGKLTIKLRLKLGSFTVEPYEYPQACNRANFRWLPTNVTAFRAYLTNVEGVDTPLASGVSEDINDARYPNAANTNYAGAWKQQFGQLLIDDEGYDNTLVPGGVSAATMSDEETITSFQLGTGRTWFELRLEFDLDNDVDPVEVQEITLKSFDKAAVAIPESGHHQAIVSESGPGIRYSNWSWWFAPALQTVPLIYPPGYPAYGGWKPSLLDALCFKRVVLDTENRGTGLVAEIRTLFRDAEITGVLTSPAPTPTAAEAYERADTFTQSVVLPVNTEHNLNFILVDSYKEAPPIPDCWHFDIDPVTMERNTTQTQKQYVYDVDHQYLVAAATVPHMFDPTRPNNPAITEVAVDYAAISAWWKVTRHLYAVNNQENFFYVVSAGLRYAYSRPWQGFFAILPPNGVQRIHACPQPAGPIITVRITEEGRKLVIDRWGVDDRERLDDTRRVLGYE